MGTLMAIIAMAIMGLIILTYFPTHSPTITLKELKDEETSLKLEFTRSDRKQVDRVEALKVKIETLQDEPSFQQQLPKGIQKSAQRYEQWLRVNNQDWSPSDVEGRETFTE